ncbi:chemotaxis protein [Bradyrhizobium sp.]|uniref:chemotaxis protein n=1 Tax=Bradyrhizobium sp. TaxID=376 RepID=UPI0026328F3A|nr:chemotaxis protein [Bradyrhizobium sp.]
MFVTDEGDAINAAMAAADDVSSRIEESFTRAGQDLGRGHAIFKGLSQALTSMSEELSGAQIEEASEALHDIADGLNGLAQALPAESRLLAGLIKAASEASELLKPLFKHVQMIAIIARSARIEAASLAEDREGFLAFTKEAHELAKAVLQSLEACARDQDLLSKAVEIALGRQNDFELGYHAQLISEAGELTTAYSSMQEQRAKSVHLADLAGRSAKKVAESVGRSIVSLQAGDSTRQRLEHFRQGLALAGVSAPSLAPPTAAAADPGVICALEAMQLKDTESELRQQIGQILGALSAITSDAAGVVDQGRSLYGSGSGDSSPFLVRIRQILAHASVLIVTCESAGRSVDDALTLVEDTLRKFRDTIAGLSEAVVDITLIGMNASLKAGHLGRRGNAFVVIANELKATADQMSVGATRLKPALEGIETSAQELRTLRLRSDPAQLTRLEPQLLHALQEIEAGNNRLAELIRRLIEDGGKFENLIGSASQLMTKLGENAAALPRLADRLDAVDAGKKTSLAAADEAVLAGLFTAYTMEREREVHWLLLRTFGLAPKMPASQPAAAIDDVLLF